MEEILTNEYSVWLEPSEPGELGDLITAFSKRAGAPNFLPHVTLIPGLVSDEQELIARTKQLIGGGSIQLLLSGPKTGGAYHKCFYLECEDSLKLTELRTQAEEIFSITTSYHPHLSLAYGLSDPTLRKEFLAELEGKEFSMTVDVISLWHARGKVEDWSSIGQWKL